MNMRRLFQFFVLLILVMVFAAPQYFAQSSDAKTDNILGIKLGSSRKDVKKFLAKNPSLSREISEDSKYIYLRQVKVAGETPTFVIIVFTNDRLHGVNASFSLPSTFEKSFVLYNSLKNNLNAQYYATRDENYTVDEKSFSFEPPYNPSDSDKKKAAALNSGKVIVSAAWQLNKGSKKELEVIVTLDLDGNTLFIYHTNEKSDRPPVE